MISRTDVLKQINHTLDHHCRGCEILKQLNKKHASNFSKIDGYCNTQCPIGKQLQVLGKAMDAETSYLERGENMIPKKLDVDLLHKLFMSDLPISHIADQLDTVESEVHYALAKLRKKNPEMWPKRNSGYVREKVTTPDETPKEKVKIESSFRPILPPIEKVNSEVVTRKMTPEEIDRLSKLGKQTTDSTGARIPKVNNYFNKSKETIEMKKVLTMEQYLIEKAAGKGNAQVERDWDMKPNSLYPLLKKWEVTGAKMESSKQEDTSPSMGIIGKPGVSGAFKTEELNYETAVETVKAKPDDKLTAILNYVRELAGPDPRSAIFDQISAERQRQDELHPLFSLELRTDVLLEEVGEVAKAKLEGNLLDLRKELIEVAAVAVRWVEALDRDQP